MPDPKLDLLLHHRPVRISVGLLAGLLFGSLIAFLLVHAPSSEWLGPYPTYMEDCELIMAMFGGSCGLGVGLVVVLFALGLQRWRWRGSRLDLGAWHSEPEGLPNQPDRGINGDVRITRRTNIAGSMD